MSVRVKNLSAQILTELPGEVCIALQRRVAEGVPAVHQPGVGQHLDPTQGQ